MLQGRRRRRVRSQCGDGDQPRKRGSPSRARASRPGWSKKLAYEDPECDGLALILVEKTFDWFAQDDAGNVWYFGEETFDCEGAGSCELGEGSWEAGKDVADVGTIAEPGLIMLANPRNGDQYYQEFYEGFAEDQARVTGVGVTVTLEREDAWPGSPFTGCLKTKEWTQLDPGAVEQKYYCPGIGLVAVDEHHGKELRFELVTARRRRRRTRSISAGCRGRARIE